MVDHVLAYLFFAGPVLVVGLMAYFGIKDIGFWTTIGAGLLVVVIAAASYVFAVGVTDVFG